MTGFLDYSLASFKTFGAARRAALSCSRVSSCVSTSVHKGIAKFNRLTESPHAISGDAFAALGKSA
jgi:hypothetical protein